jgi:hypothetical protein
LITHASVGHASAARREARLLLVRKALAVTLSFGVALGCFQLLLVVALTCHNSVTPIAVICCLLLVGWGKGGVEMVKEVR